MYQQACEKIKSKEADLKESERVQKQLIESANELKVELSRIQGELSVTSKNLNEKEASFAVSSQLQVKHESEIKEKSMQLAEAKQ